MWAPVGLTPTATLSSIFHRKSMHRVRGGGEDPLFTSSLLLVGENLSHWEVDVVVSARKGNETGITTAKHQVGAPPGSGLQLFLLKHFYKRPRTTARQNPQGCKWTLTSQLCDLGQMTSPLWATVASPVKWGRQWLLLHGKPRGSDEAMQLSLIAPWYFRVTDSSSQRFWFLWETALGKNFKNAPPILSTVPGTKYSINVNLKKKKKKGAKLQVVTSQTYGMITRETLC